MSELEVFIGLLSTAVKGEDWSEVGRLQTDLESVVSKAVLLAKSELLKKQLNVQLAELEQLVRFATERATIARDASSDQLKALAANRQAAKSYESLMDNK